MNAIDATRLAGIVPRGSDLNVIGITHGPERYVWIYDNGQEREVMRIAGRFAADPELSFTWYHAAVITTVITTAVRHRADNKCEGK